MFKAIVVCAAGISCELTGEYRSDAGHATAALCVQHAVETIKMLGRDPVQFRIACPKKRKAK